ncbi:uncharacterized protein LOC114265220 [Camellia sinensis]|uniref:uncharacterized protein LOC114265220 n=1 Tax=Camellia sinensis TaxID=4442 RepID=UPI001036C2AD|nr:uncharacterized protein LOC114265220 [Camellia sinensis]
MAPYEALSPICGAERLKTVQSCQKSYADVRRRDREYEVGDRVFIKITLMKGQMQFGVKGKLTPRYVGPYEILEKINSDDYTYEEMPIQIVNRRIKRLRNRKIPLVKVD